MGAASDTLIHTLAGWFLFQLFIYLFTVYYFNKSAFCFDIIVDLHVVVRNIQKDPL